MLDEDALPLTGFARSAERLSILADGLSLWLKLKYFLDGVDKVLRRSQKVNRRWWERVTSASETVFFPFYPLVGI